MVSSSVHCASWPSAYLFDIAYGVFAWQQLSDSVKDNLQYYHGISDCMFHFITTCWIINLLVVAGLFYKQSEKGPSTPARTAARNAFTLLPGDVKQYAYIILARKNGVSSLSKRHKVAYPEISLTCLNESLEAIQVGQSSLELQLFEHLRATTRLTGTSQLIHD